MYEDEVDKTKIIKLYKEGLAIPQIVAKTGYSRYHVYSTVREARLLRNISLTKLWQSNEWRKLIGTGKGKSTKIVSIPHSILKRFGFKRGENLMGKWIVEDNKLVLQIKRIEEGGEK